ncbi:glutamyl-tRNA synthetase [Phellopilus nigrolimitatus]|nr:glutamyl-tRNA synthetase [Phellopilus nigrolimitatus]
MPISKVPLPVLRFAPSPTGSLHLGGLRTALFNHLFAKKHGGKWILRIEDTDKLRFVHGAVDNIRQSLEWAGLEYDYGLRLEGTTRNHLYREYANKLIQNGHAYHCFCTASHLSDVRDKLKKLGSNATYDKACLHLSEEEVARRKRAGEKYVIRLNDAVIPSRSTPADLIFGTLKDAHNSLPTDPILHKSDGFPTYHLASVVDDHEMGITHVLRGEEWLPSLPLHLDIYTCLGLSAPHFAHLPLLLNSDGSKMSKRKGDVSVTDYINKDWMAPAVLNWLALAGWGVGSASETGGVERKEAPASTDMLTLDELIEKLDLSALTSRRTILDPKKLEVINKKHLQRLWSSLDKRFENHSEALAKLNIKEILLAVKDRLRNINELPSMLEFLFEYDAPSSSDKAPPSTEAKVDPKRHSEVLSKYIEAINLVRSNGLVWDELTIRTIEDMREEKDELVLLRRALTGKKTGLPLVTTMLLLGQDETLRRLTNSFQWTGVII